jgi:hypothetical protein
VSRRGIDSLAEIVICGGEAVTSVGGNATMQLGQVVRILVDVDHLILAWGFHGHGVLIISYVSEHKLGVGASASSIAVSLVRVLYPISIQFSRQLPPVLFSALYACFDPFLWMTFRNSGVQQLKAFFSRSSRSQFSEIWVTAFALWSFLLRKSPILKHSTFSFRCQMKSGILPTFGR